MGWESCDLLYGSPVGPFIGSDTGLPLGGFLVFNREPHVDLLVISDNPHGSKVRYPIFVGYPLWAKFVIPRTVYDANCLLPTYVLFPSIPWQWGHKEICRDYDGDRNWEVLVDLGSDWVFGSLFYLGRDGIFLGLLSIYHSYLDNCFSTGLILSVSEASPLVRGQQFERLTQYWTCAVLVRCLSFPLLLKI